MHVSVVSRMGQNGQSSTRGYRPQVSPCVYDGHMTSGAKREIERFIRELAQLGYEVQRSPRSGHYKIKGDGKTLGSLPCTPGGGETCARQIIRRERKKLGLPV